MRGRRFAFLFLGLALAPAPARALAGERVELDRVVAVVGDEVILESELETATDRHPLWGQTLDTLPPGATAQQQATARRGVEPKVLDELIDVQLMKAEAEKFDIKVTPEEVEQSLLSIARQNGMTVEELRSQVEKSPEYGSWAEYQAELREQILLYKVPHYLATWSVSEAQIREHYRKMTKDETAKVKVEQFTFSPPSQKSEDRDRAFAAAQAVARRLRDGEAAPAVAEGLANAAREERTIAKGDIAPAMEDMIFAAKPNQVIGPLASGQGYVVFKLVEHIEAAALGYEQVKDRIQQQLESEAFMKAEQDLRRQLRAKAHIDIRL